MTPTTSGLRVDPSNAEQAKAWDGGEGAYWAAHAGHFDRSVAGYHLPFLEAAAMEAGEQVLDIGCGTGQTTRDAARRASAGGALGVDLSADMIALARQLAAAEGLSNARFEQADAQIHPFGQGPFDVAISRTGAMFFGNPPAAFANVARALPAGAAGAAQLAAAASQRVGRRAHRRARRRPGPARAPAAGTRAVRARRPRLGAPAAGRRRVHQRRDRPDPGPDVVRCRPRRRLHLRARAPGLDAGRRRRGSPHPGTGRPAGHGHRPQHGRWRRLQIRCLADPGPAGLMGRPTDGARACKPAEAYDAIPLPTLGPGGGPCAEPPSGHG
jgi:SAM-dependent methyltransferase